MSKWRTKTRYLILILFCVFLVSKIAWFNWRKDSLTNACKYLRVVIPFYIVRTTPQLILHFKTITTLWYACSLQCYRLFFRFNFYHKHIWVLPLPKICPAHSVTLMSSTDIVSSAPVLPLNISLEFLVFKYGRLTLCLVQADRVSVSLPDKAIHLLTDMLCKQILA